jgi:hypothetical protein
VVEFADFISQEEIDALIGTDYIVYIATDNIATDSHHCDRTLADVD